MYPKKLTKLDTLLRQAGLAKTIHCDILGFVKYTFSWLACAIASHVSRYLSSCMKVSSVDTAGGTMVEAPDWPDQPQGPPFLNFFR